MSSVSSHGADNNHMSEAGLPAMNKDEGVARTALSFAGLSIVLVCAVAVAWGTGRTNGMW